eukprot:TRINITY_DN103778_c0_g1_i1.p2 TRINITY_DN103778_c0_g1~~TRINITY_DN103778_c0_g1_i1.p2  ORF type:complete len:191 (+),score=28.59 TRINITY_DN103778_c0_g1_i1:95-667(+)
MITYWDMQKGKKVYMDAATREGVLHLQETYDKAAMQGIRQAYEIESAYNYALNSNAMVIVLDWSWIEQKEMIRQNWSFVGWLRQKIYYWFLGFDATFLSIKGYNMLDIYRWLGTPEIRDAQFARLKWLAPAYYKVQIEMRNQDFHNKLKVMKDKGVCVVGMGHMEGLKELWKKDFGEGSVVDVGHKLKHD